MNSQFVMWLYPIVLLSAVSLIFRLRLPWQWSWPFVIQSIPMILCGVLGLTVGPDWMYAIIGWALVFLFYAPPKVFYNDLQKYLTALDATNLRRAGKRISLLFWGLSGEFWRDMSEVLALFVERKPEEAAKLLDKWQGRSGLPKSVAQIPGSYRLIGNGVMWHWDDIIADFHRLNAEGKISSAMQLSAARAFAEQGNFSESAHCLKAAGISETNLPLNTLALTLLPFFALIGATTQTNALLRILAKRKTEFPEYSRLYWTGRCQWANQEFDSAQATLEQALKISMSELFRDRIESQLVKVRARQEPTTAALLPEEKSALIGEVWQLFSRAAFVQEIIAPRRKSVAVIVIIAILFVIYCMTDLVSLVGLLGHDTAMYIFARAQQEAIFNAGALIPASALKGEYWRFFTYLFLHAHFTHFALNVIGLYWFGRVAENIFGTSRFLAIYIVGGLLSGVAHALVCPNLPAVGASGAVMAMFGAVAAGIYRLKDRIPESIWRLELSWLAGMAASQLVLDQFVPKVAAFAHIGGMLSGLAIGMILSIRAPGPDEVDGTQRFIGG